MKRWFVITGGCLLLGVVITVLVAWGIELFDRRTPRVLCAAVGASYEPFGGWMAPVPDDWPGQPEQTALCVQGGLFDVINGAFRWRHGTRTRFRQGMGQGFLLKAGGVSFKGDDPHILDRVIVGWPVATMTRRGPEDARAPPASGVARVWFRGIEVPVREYPAATEMRRLPVRPIWGPFVLSAIGWGLVVAAPYWVWKGGRAWRARARVKRGRCAWCGYELAGLEQCPECGKVG